jgi:predicted nuclease with RNAse H fold
VRTLGIDLAAQPERTAVCAVTWEDDTALVEVVPGRHDDDELLTLLTGAWDKIGIDCPLGWPEPFIDALAAHRKLKSWPGRGVDPDTYRKLVKYRLTDLVIAEREGRSPLSVSSDLIGVVALRCALLLDRYSAKRKPVRRDGAGVIAEVYPAAALRRWLPEAKGSYKRRGDYVLLRSLVADVSDALPLKFADGSRELCETSHDAFDALVCALVARAVTLRETRRPRSREEIRRAITEGWIHVPKKSCTLADLAEPAKAPAA